MNVIDSFDVMVFAMKEVRDAAKDTFAPMETAVVLGQTVDRDERSVGHEPSILARGSEKTGAPHIFAMATQPNLRRNPHEQDRLCYSLDGLSVGNVSEKFQHAALEFGGLKAESGGVKGAGNFPELLWAAGRSVDKPRVAAGKRFILFVTDEKNGEGAHGDGFFRRNFAQGNTGKFFAVKEQRPAKRPEKG